MTTDTQQPDRLLYLEDFTVGQVFELGTTTISAAEIVAFGRQFDPQPFHVDEAAALESPFGGLIASGWHSCSVLMRLWYETVLRASASLGSPGVDEVRWLEPVRPGDVLTGRGEVLSVRPSERRPERGTAVVRMTLENEEGETVVSFVGRALFGRRPAQ
jgi:acyl dehydratase